MMGVEVHLLNMIKKVLKQNQKSSKIIFVRRYIMNDKNVIHIQVSNDLKSQLEKEAKELELSLNAYIRTILLKRVK